MSEPHPAARGFGPAAEAYERGRPGYPAAAVRALVERLELRPGRMVLDLAAGTGKLTRALVPAGASIIAVEPIREMRAQLEKRVPGVAVMTGSAERIPLADGYVDAVTVASAFHWFRTDEALREIHRVLRPGGGLALIWNTRDERDPVQAAISALLEPVADETPRRRQRDWRAVLDESGLFTPCETSLYAHRQELDEDGLVDRVLSVSMIASAPARRRAEIGEQVRALARERDGHVVLPYVTEVYLAFRPVS